MLTLTLFIVLIALVFDFLNGMNDAANSIATIVSTRVLTPKLAVLWAAFFNFVAAFGFGVAVAKTIGKDIVDPSVITEQLILGGLIGSIVWTYVCTRYGLPISVSHALMGGFAGAGVAKAGFGVLITEGITKIGIFIILSPIIGLIFSFVFMIIVTWIVKDSPLRKVDKVFRLGQLVSSAAYSLGHGTNDAQKTMGIIAALLFASQADMPTWLYDKSEGFYVPTWVILSAHTAIGLGTLLGGWRVVRTMGVKITSLKPIHGFCAEFGASLVLGGTALFGIAVSTTHTITGAIMGVGATKRLSAVRWGVAEQIVMAWLLTIPGSGLLAALSYWLLHFFF
ncbi:MAG: inorganic phosphate transporter [Bacteroidota bacterium]